MILWVSVCVRMYACALTHTHVFLGEVLVVEWVTERFPGDRRAVAVRPTLYKIPIHLAQ